MTGTLKFKVQTDDAQGRLVEHRPILGSKAGAVKEALRRRYRLRGGEQIVLTLTFGHMSPDYGRGTFEVFFGAFMKPAHSGWFMVEQVTELTTAQVTAVFVVLPHLDYEGYGAPLSAHTTREAAWLAAAAIKKQSNDKYTKYEVEEVALAAEGKGNTPCT